MIELGSTGIVIFVPSLPRDEFEKYSTALFDDWDAQVARELELSDYALGLEVEEGSLRVRTKVFATIGIVYAGIANYDGVFQGLARLESQVRAVSEYVAERAPRPFPQQTRAPRVNRRRGALGQLQELFVRVQRRELTAEQAMRRAEELLGVEASESPEFMRSLEQSLEGVPLYPEQLFLPMALPEEVSVVPEEDDERRPTPTRQRPTVPPPERVRCEIWRGSKKGTKSVTVTVL